MSLSVEIVNICAKFYSIIRSIKDVRSSYQLGLMTNGSSFHTSSPSCRAAIKIVLLLSAPGGYQR